MSLIKENEIYLKNVINDLEMNIDKISLEPSSRKEFGQFQTNQNDNSIHHILF